MLVQRNPLFVLPSKIENERSKALIIKKTDRTTVSELKRTIANMQEIPDTDRTTVSELKRTIANMQEIPDIDTYFVGSDYDRNKVLD